MIGRAGVNSEQGLFNSLKNMHNMLEHSAPREPEPTEMRNSELLPLKEAAMVAGVSRPTLFRAVQKGELPAQSEPGQNGKLRYLLSRHEVENWSRLRRETELPHVHRQGTTEQREPILDAQWELVEQEDEQEEPTTNASERSPERLNEEYEPTMNIPVSVHLHLVNELRRMERESLSLAVELSRHRLALAENAESIVEREARARQAEAIAEQNAEQLAQFELERAELTERMKTMETRVNWLEKRVPRWVRAMFGAS